MTNPKSKPIWISDHDSDPRQSSTKNPQQLADSDGDLLDAYSRAVIHVVDTVSPAVVSISSEDRRNGSGSGFLITRDGYAITNHHVTNDRKQLVAQTVDGDRVEELARARDADEGRARGRRGGTGGGPLRCEHR